MGDFLLYDVWGGLMFNLPFLAFSALVGWVLTNAVLKNRKLNKKTIVAISAVVAIVIFLLLKSQVS